MAVGRLPSRAWLTRTLLGTESFVAIRPDQQERVRMTPRIARTATYGNGSGVHHGRPCGGSEKPASGLAFKTAKLDRVRARGTPGPIPIFPENSQAHSHPIPMR